MRRIRFDFGTLTLDAELLGATDVASKPAEVREKIVTDKIDKWLAEISLDEEATLAGRVTLQLADLAWVGTVVSGGPSGGRSQYRLVGGAGGWARSLRCGPAPSPASWRPCGTAARWGRSPAPVR